jgi:DNA-binding CsgD family transcriptional regulator
MVESQAVIDAHEFGIVEGSLSDPWSYGYVNAVIGIYRQCLPATYLTSVSLLFTASAEWMVESVVPTRDFDPSWGRLGRYLTLGGALLGASQGTRQGEPMRVRNSSILRYDLLAAQISHEGARDLRTVCETLLDALREWFNPLTPEERAILFRLSSGERMVDVGVELGYAERTLHRRMQALTGRLGLSSRSEAISVAIQQGWLG